MDLSGGYISSETPPRTQSPAQPSPLQTKFVPASEPAMTSPPLDESTPTEPLSQDGVATTKSASAAPTGIISLDQELAGVMKGFGSFWGKVKKQSYTAYQTAEKQMETARKDLTPLVEKARANLDSFSETTKNELAKLSEQGTNSGVVIGADGMPIIIDEPVTVRNEAVSALTPVEEASEIPKANEKGKGKEIAQETEIAAAETSPSTETVHPSESTAPEIMANPAATAAQFFNKVQTQLAANSNVKGLSKNLAHLQTNLSALPESLQTNYTQLQEQLAKNLDITETQKSAEIFLHKGESWLQGFSHEMSRMAKDAIQVLPPSETDLQRTRQEMNSERLKKAEKVAVGRKEMLKHKLQTESAALLIEPAQNEIQAYEQFVAEIDTMRAADPESWTRKIQTELESAGGALVEKGLGETFRRLVPKHLEHDQFWLRYFFRLHQIELDEARRKQVLEASTPAAETEESAEDFSWESDEEPETQPEPSHVTQSTSLNNLTVPISTSVTGVSTPDTPKPDQTAPAPSEIASTETSPIVGTSSAAPASNAATSPRASSDDTSSYDVVGLTSGNVSGTEGKEEASGSRTKIPLQEENDEAEDSDWE